jgi:hypothetical protein
MPRVDGGAPATSIAPPPARNEHIGALDDVFQLDRIARPKWISTLAKNRYASSTKRKDAPGNALRSAPAPRKSNFLTHAGIASFRIGDRRIDPKEREDRPARRQLFG